MSKPKARSRIGFVASEPAKLEFVQIVASPVENVQETQTVLMLYGLDKDGAVWGKRMQDTEWHPEPMRKAERTTE